MEVVYTGEEMPAKIVKSLFLVGPTPRNKEEQESWRPDALRLLEDIGFDGTVFVPEDRNGEFKLDYDDQVGWEEKYLNLADCIVFWVPRDLDLDSKGYPKMAGFTTNVEFGAWAESGKIVFGAPPAATKNGYLKHYCEKYNVPIGESLTETLSSAIDKLGEGIERVGGERYVPLFVWKQDSFQDWYQSQTKAGNRLEQARLLYTFRPRYKDFMFLWILQASIYVSSEDRIKDNEFVLSRPSISSVCLYYPTSNSIQDYRIILVKEFRTPASTEDGFIRELPGGSAITSSSPEEVAAEEVQEETGMYLDPKRLKMHGARQLAGTFSAHKSYLFSAEITKDELTWFESQENIPHGKAEDSERTFVEIYSVRELLDSKLIDYTTLGMIFEVLDF